jgi:hypothetical protein
MDILSVLLLAAPLVALDIDLEKASPGYRVASREQIFSAIEKPLKSDEPEIEISNYLGRARTYGYVEWNFVIRATTREHAYELLEKFVGRLNSPESLADIQRQGGGQVHLRRHQR